MCSTTHFIINNSDRFTIYDADDNEVLVIVGPMCTFSICGDVEFKVTLLILYIQSWPILMYIVTYDI